MMTSDSDTRTLLVFGDKTFKITIPKAAKVTFGPWSPPTDKSGQRWDGESKRGTLRIYDGANIVGVFAGVNGFRDLSLSYAEEVAREEGATIWKDDEHGYMRENKVKQTRDWIDDPVKRLTAASNGRRKPAARVSK